eukprot:CAMPEP_0172674514 /NCGR_PEP_ID=MMETSP1074-20121228/12775_1 /TAXON_ID=2916 /ORGANISM="Ceratium fusus, Strain PA161109" /LENGTH=516 /DNA_ID=CAMNT_0013491925 /DNA_START=1 /DNA_END=1551 /DNA_ORIENTATION=-
MALRNIAVIALSFLLVATSGTVPSNVQHEHRQHDGHHEEQGGSEANVPPEHSDGHEGNKANVHPEHHHENKIARVVTKALSSELLCTVAWVMCLSYFINSADRDIINTTWHIISEMISIFMAVLLYNAVSRIANVSLAAVDHHKPPTWEMRISAAVRMVGFFVLLAFVLYKLRFHRPTKEGRHSFLGLEQNSPKHKLRVLRVVGTLGAHFLGFAMIDVFGMILEVHFDKHVLLCLVGFVVCVLIVSLMHVVASYIRTKLKLPGREREEEEWMEVCAELENESASLAMGLVLSLFVRFAITGHMPRIHSPAQGHSVGEVWKLFACALGFGVLLIPVAVIGAHAKHGGHPEDDNWKVCVVHRASDFAERLMIMSMGWCLLYWGKWFYWEVTNNKGLMTDSLMGGEMVQVMLFSAISFISIRHIDCVADYLRERGSEYEVALRRLITMFALLMGLSWESAFTSAVHVIGEDFEGTARVLFDAVLTLGICLAVLPAWAWHILPKTIRGVDRALTKSLSPR